MSKIALDVIVKQSGSRTDGFINVAQKADYTWFQIPMILIEGARPGPTLLLEACTHGDEQEGALAALRIAAEYGESGDFAGTLAIIPALNAEAFSQFSRSSITDGNNLNRVYPGNTTSYITPRIAAVYEERVMVNADAAICYHGGGQVLHLEPIVSYNWKHGGSVTETALGMSKAFNAPYVWHPKSANFTGYAEISFNAHHIPSITAECGSQCSRLHDLEKNIRFMYDGTKQVMAYLGMIPEVPFQRVKQKKVDMMYIHSHHGGFHHIAKKQNEAVKEGEVLNYITDIFGNVIEEIKAPCDGIVNGFWSVPVIRPGDWSSLFMPVLEELDGSGT